MAQLKVHVPTYYGGAFEKEVAEGEKPEFGDPYVPVLAREADGVRIVLGSHDYFDMSKPDIQIERRPNGWAIFLHPEAGGDASGFLYFLDDGRSFVSPENATTPAVEMLEQPKAAALVDGIEPPEDAETTEADSKKELCELCENYLEIDGDNWDGLCPECADRVSDCLDDNELTSEDRDEVVALLRSTTGGPHFTISQEQCESPQLVERILQKARKNGCYSVASLHMARALLLQWADSPRGIDVPSLHPLAQKGRDFPVGDSCFHVLAGINDGNLATFRRLTRKYRCPTVLCPPWCKRILSKITATERHLSSLRIQALDEYASLRIVFTSMDTKQRWSRIAKELLDRYNALLMETGQPQLKVHVIQDSNTRAPGPSH
jgi:hypothetical protein